MRSAMSKMTKRESILLLLFKIFFLTSKCGGLGREKRTLLWPPGGSKMLVIVGYGLPVDLKSETVIFGSVLKANYRYPTNVSQISGPQLLERKRRAVTRWNMYGLLSQAIEMWGFEGKSCVLRAICEVAHTPLEKNCGLFHELIHVIFTPTTTYEKIDHHTDNEYYAAQILGRNGGACGEIFRDCRMSLIDLFTVYSD